MASELNAIKNLGPRSIDWLESVGICRKSQLTRMGPVVAYQLVRQKHPEASLNLLWALAAGLQGLHWAKLDGAEKNRLLSELDSWQSESSNNG